MKPFDDYPGKGNSILQKMSGENARQGYGKWLMDNASQYSCVYCGVSLVDDYYHWLLLNVGHVIPAKECTRLGIPNEWHDSYTNIVLACSGCNLFENRFRIEWEEPKATNEWTDLAFVSLRDQVFKERKERILKRRRDEVAFFTKYIEGYSLPGRV